MSQTSENKPFLFVEDVMNILGISQSKAYSVIRDLNKRLEEKCPGTITIRGRVSKKFFAECFYDNIIE